jgi:hypothetical protein
MQRERQHVSREVPILLGIALALETSHADIVVEVLDDLFDVAGFKRLQ